jgi:hypothetical protein
LIEVGLADEQRARLEQPRHRGRRRHRHVGEVGARGGGGKPGDVDVVFDGERDSVKWKDGARLLLRRQRLCVAHHVGARAERRPDARRFLPLDTGEDQLGDVDGRALAGGVGVAQRAKVHG